MFDWVQNTSLLQVSVLTRTFFWEFFWIFRTSYQQSNCEQISRQSLTALSELFCISWSFLFLVWSHFTCALPKTNIWKQDFQKWSIFLKQLPWGAEINSNLWRAFSILKKQKKGNPKKIKWKKVPSKFSEISVMNAWFVSKIISFNFMWLQVVTCVCMKSWLYSPLLSSSTPAHLFAIFLKLLWGRGCFTAEASTTLNLA